MGLQEFSFGHYIRYEKSIKPNADSNKGVPFFTVGVTIRRVTVFRVSNTKNGVAFDSYSLGLLSFLLLCILCD